MKAIGFCLLHQHDLRILALAVLLTILTVLTTGALARRSHSSRLRPLMWSGLAGLCIAIGAWSIHFVAVLAYLPGVPTSFRFGATLASLVLVAATSIPTFVLSRADQRQIYGRAACGIAFGLGVAAMHYLGMSAFQAQGQLAWSWAPVVWSVALSASLSAVGFAVGGLSPIHRRRLPLAGVLVALSILSLHFTGMSAITFRFDPLIVAPTSSLSRPVLALLISTVSAVVFALGTILAYQEHLERRRSLGRMKLLSRSSFEGVALLSSHTIAEANDALAAMFGSTRQALIGHAFGHLFQPDDGVALRLDGRTEGVLHSLDGRTVPVEVLSRASGGGDLIIAVRDLTERRAREESLSLLFNRNPAPVWVNEAGGRILAVNPAALALYGHSEESFLSLRLEDLVASFDHEALREHIERHGRCDADRTWTHRRADGAELFVRVFAEKITYQGRAAYLFTVFDVTERQRSALALEAAKEAAEAANLAKTTFLANISHEIRTPLNGVLGMSQAIAAGELSSIQRQRLEVVLQSGNVLLTLLNDLLDVSKIEAGKVDLEDIDFDLSALVKDLTTTYATLAEAKDLSFEALWPNTMAGRRRGDPTRLRQVLSNLLSNAIKFTVDGGVTMEVRLSHDDEVCFSVRDTGEGIAPAALQNLFQKFVQADASTTRRHGGTGLGLSISRDLARMMGGEIEVASELGNGSAFTLTIRLPSVEAFPDIESREAEDAAHGSSGVRILAAEDNATNRLVLSTLLAQDGIELTMVENGAEALQAWRRGVWDVVLMDIQMPVMDGLTAVRAIRAEEVQHSRARTPIVAMTANVMTNQLLDYNAAGMDGCVAKPIDLKALFSAIDRAICADVYAAA